jgi:DNA-binding NarL/FixJ family response regulator
MIRILIVDDQRLIRESFKLMLASERRIEVIGVAENGQVAIEQVEALSPDVVLMDLMMPGIDGLTATRIIMQRFPATRVLILTGSPDEQAVENAISVGAKGFLPKDVSAQELVGAIQALSQGHTQFGPGLLEKLAARLLSYNLSSPPTLNRDRSSLILGSLHQVIEVCTTLDARLGRLEATFKQIHR